MAKEWSMKFTDIPLGAWDMRGNWYPNHNLNMSASEQRRHNMIGGHFERTYNIDDYRLLCVGSEPEPTLWQRIKSWVYHG